MVEDAAAGIRMHIVWIILYKFRWRIQRGLGGSAKPGSAVSLADSGLAKNLKRKRRVA